MEQQLPIIAKAKTRECLQTSGKVIWPHTKVTVLVQVMYLFHNWRLKSCKISMEV